jgi:N-acetylmuramoyl-L-alanine amidase
MLRVWAGKALRSTVLKHWLAWVLLFAAVVPAGSDAWATEAKSASVPIRIVVDPGHGGRDAGALAPGGLQEKDLALTLARDLREEARSMGGFQVLLTREEDEMFSSARRRAASTGASLWLSIHLNADFEGKARGPRVFYWEGNGNGAPQRQPRGSNSGGPSDVGAILQDMTRTKLGNESVLLAEHLQRGLEAAWGVGSRSSGAGPFLGLQELEIPAVVVEVGFITNQADQRGLTDPNRRRQLVKAILRAVRSFFQDPRREQ